jgi:hypothetical protein
MTFYTRKNIGLGVNSLKIKVQVLILPMTLVSKPQFPYLLDNNNKVGSSSIYSANSQSQVKLNNGI